MNWLARGLEFGSHFNQFGEGIRPHLLDYVPTVWLHGDFADFRFSADPDFTDHGPTGTYFDSKGIGRCVAF